MSTEPLKQFLCGAVGGAVGVLAMRGYWKVASALEGEDPRALTKDDGPHALDEMDVAGQHHQEGESSTAAVGRHGYEAVTGEEPSDDEKARLSQGVHWGYGLATAGLYSAIRGRVGAPDVPGGAAFGTALWVFGDELAVPLLGLSDGPTAFPVRQHAHRLGAHLAFGLATAAVSQVLMGAVTPRRSRSESALDTAKSLAGTYLKWKAAKKLASAAATGVQQTMKRKPLRAATRTTSRAATRVAKTAVKAKVVQKAVNALT